MIDLVVLVLLYLTNLRKKIKGVIYLRTKVALVRKKHIIRINWLAIS